MKECTLITGASRGIGLELTRIAAREKNNLVLVARDEKELLKVSDELKQSGVSAEYIAIDLAKRDSALKIYGFCEQKKLTISTLINNAGFGDYGPFAQSDIKKQLAMIDVNIRSLTEMTHLFLPSMLKNKSGMIMNVGSVAGFLPGPNMSVYYATKNYVISFSRALSEELKGTGVSATCLCPGPTKTNFSSSAQVSRQHATATTKVTAREVAEFGWYAMNQGDVVAIHGSSNKIAVQLTKFVPRNLLVRLIKKLQK